MKAEIQKKAALTLILTALILVTGIGYQWNDHQKRARYRDWLMLYHPDFHGKERNPLEIERAIQMMANGTKFGRQHFLAVDEARRKARG